MYSLKNSKLLDLLFLTATLSALFFVLLGFFPIEAPDSVRYTQIAREMLLRLDFITPHLNGIAFLQTPPLFYWLQTATFKTLGITNFAAHFTNALVALVTCLLTYLVGRKLFSRQAGIAASLILATTALFFGMARIVTLDMSFTLFLSAILFSFSAAEHTEKKSSSRNYLWCAYACAGLAVLTKGLIGLWLLGLIILLWLGITNNWRKLKNYQHIIGCLIFLIIALPWHILAQHHNPGFLQWYIAQQNPLHYFTQQTIHQQPFYFFAVLFLISLGPWLAFLPSAIKNHLPKPLKSSTQHPIETLLLIWPITILVFFTFAKSQQPALIIPMFPPVALIIGSFFSKLWQTPSRKNLFSTILFTAVLAITILISLGILIFEHHINFDHLLLCPTNLYIISLLCSITGLTTYLLYLITGNRAAFYTLVGGWILVLISTTPIISMANNKSIKPLIDVLNPQLTSKTKIAIYKTYYQEIPYYLERNVIVVDHKGRWYVNDKTKYDNLINDKKFFQKWNSSTKMVAFTNKDQYEEIIKAAKPDKLYIVATYRNTMLLSNHY